MNIVLTILGIGSIGILLACLYIYIRLKKNHRAFIPILEAHNTLIEFMETHTSEMYTADDFAKITTMNEERLLFKKQIDDMERKIKKELKEGVKKIQAITPEKVDGPYPFDPFGFNELLAWSKNTHDKQVAKIYLSITANTEIIGARVDLLNMTLAYTEVKLLLIKPEIKEDAMLKSILSSLHQNAMAYLASKQKFTGLKDLTGFYCFRLAHIVDTLSAFGEKKLAESLNIKRIECHM